MLKTGGSRGQVQSAGAFGVPDAPAAESAAVAAPEALAPAANVADTEGMLGTTAAPEAPLDTQMAEAAAMAVSPLESGVQLMQE